jgi:Peptidase A4 family
VKRFVALATTIGGSALLSLGGATAFAGSSALAQVGGPMIRTHGGVTAAGVPTISENWSGYAATAPKKFTGVSSEFVQPAVTCPGKPKQYTSNWVGLDGFDNETVEQDGTFGFCGGKHNTTPEYEAWYEMYPAGSVNVFKVKPGDVMDASVKYFKGKFTLTIADKTSGKSATDVAACSTCERTSAEWIIERPAGCDASGCFLFALADFGTTTMSNDWAGTGGGLRSIASFTTTYPIYMVQPLNSGGFISLDAVGPIDPSNSSFQAVWERSGRPTPITLSPRQ